MLEIKGLRRQYAPAAPVLEDVNLRFPDGGFTVIAGPNGSGKTQLMRHLNGLLKPQQGVVRLDGRDIREDLNTARRRIGLVFQNADSQIVGQTVASDICFGPENLRWPRRDINRRLEHVLTRLSLTELKDRRPHTLSGGEKRRAVLAGVLIMDPDVIVLDEPFTGLDLKGVREVLEAIVALHRDGKTIILISHDLEKCLAHADRLIILADGRIREDAPPDQLLPRLKRYGIRLPWGEGRPLETMTWLND